MHNNLTPDWGVVCGALRSKLVDIIDDMDDALDEGAEPLFVVFSTTGELKLFIEAIEEDPAGEAIGEAIGAS